MELRVNWQVPQALECYKSRKETRFSLILTISGTEIDAQAATCENYLKENFGNVGQTMLDAVQAAWDSEGRLHKTSPIKKELPRLSVNLQRSEGSECETAVITASGAPNALIEVACAFTWFCCALRPASNFNLSNFRFDFHTTIYPSSTSVDMNVELLQLLPLRDAVGDQRSCWHGLFQKAIIVLDGPISDRRKFGQLEGNERGKFLNQNRIVLIFIPVNY